MKAAFVRVFASLAGLCVLFLILGFAGAWHPMLDAISAGRWLAIFAGLACLAVAAVLQGHVKTAVGLIACIGLLVVLLANPRPDTPGNVRIYSKNLLYHHADFASVVSDIIRMDPHVVALQEVSQINETMLDDLRDRFPYQARCPWQGWNGMAVLSRWPLGADGPDCSPERSVMASKVERPEGHFWMVNVHLQQPWPDVQWQFLDLAHPILQRVNGPAVVAGDFNTMPWTAAPRRIAKLTGTQLIEPAKPTFRLWGVGLPLDQVWGAGGRAQIRPFLGSDHRGVVADVWIGDMD